MLKSFEIRSKVTIKVKWSNLMLPPERSYHNNPYAKSESPMSYGKKVICRVKVFQMEVRSHSQGHVLKMYGTNGKVLSEGTHMPNMKALSLRVRKFNQTKGVIDGQTDGWQTKWSLSGALLRRCKIKFWPPHWIPTRGHYSMDFSLNNDPP